MSDGPVLSRRTLLAIALPAAMIGLGDAAFAQDASACVNLDTLPASQKARRRSLGFKPVSPDPKKKCGGCTFYTAIPAATGCGKCGMLSGGVVSAASVCDSWAPKG